MAAALTVAAVVGAAMPADAAVACPACSAATLTRAGAGQVCPACGWEDDPTQRAEPDRTGALNGGASLSEARANVAHFGVASPPSEAGGS